MNEVQSTADVPPGLAGGRGEFITSWWKADIPALLRIVALEPFGWQMGFARNILSLGRSGIEVPSRVNGMGHYILSAAPFEDKVRELPRKGPAQFASRFSRDANVKRPGVPKGGRISHIRLMALTRCNLHSPSFHAGKSPWGVHRIQACLTRRALR